MVALDWTEFAKSDHSTLVLSVIAHDKRATPVLWKTVKRSGIQRIAVEDELLSDFVRHFHPFGSRFWPIAASQVVPCICFSVHFR